jgi:hypothetical protein
LTAPGSAERLAAWSRAHYECVAHSKTTLREDFLSGDVLYGPIDKGQIRSVAPDGRRRVDIRLDGDTQFEASGLKS